MVAVYNSSKQSMISEPWSKLSDPHGKTMYELLLTLKILDLLWTHV